MASGIGIYEKYVSASNLQTQGTLNNRPEPYATGGWLVYCSVASHERTNKAYFIVNWGKSESYRTSAIPYIQMMLNEYVSEQQ